MFDVILLQQPRATMLIPTHFSQCWIENNAESINLQMWMHTCFFLIQNDWKNVKYPSSNPLNLDLTCSNASDQIGA